MARLRIWRGRDSPARPGSGVRARSAALAGRPATAAGRAGRHGAQQAAGDRAGRAAALGRGGPHPEGQLARRARRRAAPGRHRGLRGGRLLLPAAVAPVGRGRSGRAAGLAAAGARGGRGLRHVGQHDRGPAGDGAGRGGGAAAGARASPAGPRAGLRHRGSARAAGEFGPPGRADRRRRDGHGRGHRRGGRAAAQARGHGRAHRRVHAVARGRAEGHAGRGRPARRGRAGCAAVDPVRACRTLRMDSRPRQQIMTLILIALTFGSGATDVAAFNRLGGVFSSVMTGNIVFWGLAAAERSVSLFAHAAISIAGYIAGVACGTWVAHGFKVHANGKPEEANRDSVLPAHVNWSLFAELVLLAGLAAGWEITGGRPAGSVQYVLLAGTAAAMGVQSTSVNELGLSNVSTTFLTGTLTGLVSSLV